MHPKELLEDAPGVIWPALMPCWCLPLIGSAGGDWLCLMITDQGNSAQIIQWYHGGGDWIPWGNDLAEAIIYDVIRHRLPGPKRSHAIAAVNHSPTDDFDLCPLYQWAKKFMPQPVVLAIESDASADELAIVLLEHKIAEVAVRCDQVQAALDHPLANALTPEVANNLQISWNDANEWIFDAARMPGEIAERISLTHAFQHSPLQQDWDCVLADCEHISKLAPELAWPWDIMGYAHERAGELAAAIDAYRQGVEASVYTDQSVRLRTHWMLNEAPKFSAARLKRLSPETIAASDYLTHLCSTKARQSREELTQYWLGEAQLASARGDALHQQKCLLNAGWDLGAEPMGRYASIMEQITQCAEKSGSAALASIVSTHRVCLQNRYRI